MRWLGENHDLPRFTTLVETGLPLQMLRNTSEWGRVHGGESGSAAEQRVPHALGVVKDDAAGGGGASARLTRFRRGTRWRSGNGPRHH